MALNVHFQNLTEEDFEDLKHGNKPMAGDKPVVFLGIVGLRELRNQQVGAIEGLKKALQVREVQAEKIRNDSMRSELAKNVAMEELEKKHAAEIASYMNAITNLAAEAKTQDPFWSRPAALFRCRFTVGEENKAADPVQDAAIRGDLARRLAGMSVNGLVDVARLALATQNGGNRAHAAAMCACLAEEIDARGSLTAGDHKALAAFMGQINAFDAEARRIVAEAELAAKQCVLLAQGDRRGKSVQHIANGLQARAIAEMPSV